jgi:hypothetical protein
LRFIMTNSLKYSRCNILIRFKIIEIVMKNEIRLGAFHAGNRGSNPLGDATNNNRDLEPFLSSCFHFVN